MTEKKRKRHLKLLNFSGMLLFAAVTLYLCSSLFLRGYANSLASEAQAIEARIRTLQAQNMGIETEIAQIKGHISMSLDQIGAEQGLSPNMENVLFIHGN